MFESESNSSRTGRRRPVHQPPVGINNRSTIVFLTVCTKNRRRDLATGEMHQSLVSAWQRANYWSVGRYVIMPDHIHLFCSPSTYPAEPLTPWIRYWKSIVSRLGRCKEAELWQSSFWDTQLRSHESYEQKWNYVRENPVRAGLVKMPEDWPFQGEANLLRWHE